MKLLRGLGFTFVLLLLMGATTINNGPQISIDSDNQVVVSGLGNNIAGVEVTLELSSGSYNSTSFTATNASVYAFAHSTGKKITIYATATEDMSDDGSVVLGKINTESASVFASSGEVLVVDFSLTETNYSKINVSQTITTGPSVPSTDSSLNNNSSNNSSNSNSSFSTDTEADQSDVPNMEFVLAGDETMVSLEVMEEMIAYNADHTVTIIVDNVMVKFPVGSMQLIDGVTSYNFAFSMNSVDYGVITTLVGSNLVASYNFNNHSLLPLHDDYLALITLDVGVEYTNNLLYVYKYDAVLNELIFITTSFGDEDGFVSFYTNILGNYVVSLSPIEEEDTYIQPDIEELFEEELLLGYDPEFWFRVNVTFLMIPFISTIGFYGYKLYLNRASLRVDVKLLKVYFSEHMKNSIHYCKSAISKMFKK